MVTLIDFPDWRRSILSGGPVLPTFDGFSASYHEPTIIEERMFLACE